MSEWGPWIDHDGKTPPTGSGVIQYCEDVSFGRRAHGGYIVCASYPGWRWSWRRPWWAGFRLTRVCTDPTVAPIVRYRRKLSGRKRDGDAMRKLRRIAEGFYPVDGPEGPVRAPEVTE